jgi:hypothetical protein
MFDVASARTPEPAAVSDVADMLRRFNAPDGIAHTSADGIAERATADATTLTPDDAVTSFTECAEILCTTPMSKETVISYPVVGSTTLAVVAEVALMEATVHLLDLADAVGGVEPSERALAATRDLLIAIPDPIAAIEVLAGRATQLPQCRRSGDNRHTAHSKLTANNGIKLALLTYFTCGAALRRHFLRFAEDS